LTIQRSPQPDEILEDHTTPTSFSTFPPRWGWSWEDLIARGAATTTWAPSLQTLTLKTKNEASKTGEEPSHRRVPRSTAPPRPKSHRNGRSAVAPTKGSLDRIAWRDSCLGRNASLLSES
jgi:hypothetical protein